MGHFQSLLRPANTLHKMKYQVVVLALAASALAEPEADAGYFYGRYYNNYFNRGLYAYGYPAYSGYGYHGYHGLYKRDADAQVITPASTLPLAAATPLVNPYLGLNPYPTLPCQAPPSLSSTPSLPSPP